ncbi:MAG TPA: hypothetical protein VGX71_06355 [Pseudaminobacter sp.]|nr:hypothetical protein [Pseudaminobacter sp.]
MAGATLAEGLVQCPDGEAALAGVCFINACADRAEEGSASVEI